MKQQCSSKDTPDLSRRASDPESLHSLIHFLSRFSWLWSFLSYSHTCFMNRLHLDQPTCCVRSISTLCHTGSQRCLLPDRNRRPPSWTSPRPPRVSIFQWQVAKMKIQRDESIRWNWDMQFWTKSAIIMACLLLEKVTRFPYVIQKLKNRHLPPLVGEHCSQ